MVLARLAAKRAVQDQLRSQGVRVTLVPYAEVMRQAREYLDAHPELYQQALERAQRMGYIELQPIMTTPDPASRVAEKA
jgi:peptidase E